MSSSFYSVDREKTILSLGKAKLLHALRQMLLIRHFEWRAEAAYQQGKMGGFFHSYIGQEAIQTAVLDVLGPHHWYTTSYRCHALALLLGATPKELMAELFGKATGNAKGRGGSMHFYTDRMLGGFGIVTNQVPVATGAGFSLKYLGKKNELSICFLGDGAVAQGVFHESLNMASLWDLPCLYIIENNHWGMGTHVERAVSVKKLAEQSAPSYNMKGYTVDGMDFIACYGAFEAIAHELFTTGRPVLVEAITQRFKGHSISDPGLYRTKEQLKTSMERDPILLLKIDLENHKMIDEAEYKQIDQEMRDQVLAALQFAEESLWPDPLTLEEDVFAVRGS